MVKQLLLLLQVGFVVLLYLFIWRVIRVASRDMTVGQESMVLRPVRPGNQLTVLARRVGAPDPLYERGIGQVLRDGVVCAVAYVEGAVQDG